MDSGPHAPTVGPQTAAEAVGVPPLVFNKDAVDSASPARRVVPGACLGHLGAALPDVAASDAHARWTLRRLDAKGRFAVPAAMTGFPAWTATVIEGVLLLVPATAGSAWTHTVCRGRLTLTAPLRARAGIAAPGEVVLHPTPRGWAVLPAATLDTLLDRHLAGVQAPSPATAPAGDLAGTDTPWRTA